MPVVLELEEGLIASTLALVYRRRSSSDDGPGAGVLQFQVTADFDYQDLRAVAHCIVYLLSSLGFLDGLRIEINWMFHKYTSLVLWSFPTVPLKVTPLLQ
jgi:hypothetical protein